MGLSLKTWTNEVLLKKIFISATLNQYFVYYFLIQPSLFVTFSSGSATVYSSPPTNMDFKSSSELFFLYSLNILYFNFILDFFYLISINYSMCSMCCLCVLCFIFFPNPSLLNIKLQSGYGGSCLEPQGTWFGPEIAPKRAGVKYDIHQRLERLFGS